MPNFKTIFKSAADIFGSLTDNQKDPLHVGEAMACWTYLAFVADILAHMEIALNTTTDPELKELFEDAFHVASSHKKEMSQFMRQEGIALPPMPENKPSSNSKDIPLGAKFTDNELANTVNYNFVIAADMCAASASQSLRTDVALRFIKFQIDKLSLGLKAKELMRKKGWLKIPPFYQPPGGPHNQNGGQ